MENASSTNFNLEESYTKIYDGLSGLRETFHRSGRLDDSNAKLDEVAKLFATYLAFKNGQIKTFPDSRSKNLVADLQSAFLQTTALPQYLDSNGISIFGIQPQLVLRPEDTDLAKELIDLTKQSIDIAFDLKQDQKPFDVINEAFGHFIRDNFRGNIEDAQYMTPPEVVDFMVDLVFTDLKADHQNSKNQHLVMLDPSCGVGSFLAATYHKARHTGWPKAQNMSIFGQDKVERMVRLSTINLELFSVEKHQIFTGNSLAAKSKLDSLNGKVDFILTNPPFGASFLQQEVINDFSTNTPLFSNLKKPVAKIDSELLFIDRYMTLLKDGGYLAVVIPDGVVSARGNAAVLRQHLSTVANIKAIIELPAVTFAQAGTRTKTAILYLQKNRPQTEKIFLAVSTDLGFQVSSKKGVQVKLSNGSNDLNALLNCYKLSKDTSSSDDVDVLSDSPSCVLADSKMVIGSSWTPNHYSAKRFRAINEAGKNSNFSLKPLGEIAELLGDVRRSVGWKLGDSFISVLHILGEGFVDFKGVKGHAPKTPGAPINPGEVLVSKINPRIPRISVVPNLGSSMLCSSEFEVLRPLNGFDPYHLAFLLQTDLVQKQIVSLTSGTSASHNRIRSSELKEVLIPIPIPSSKKYGEIMLTMNRYKKAIQGMTESSTELANIRSHENDFF